VAHISSHLHEDHITPYILLTSGNILPLLYAVREAREGFSSIRQHGDFVHGMRNSVDQRRVNFILKELNE
jgi:hypothetical protein